MKSGKPGADIWTRTIGRRQLLKTLGLAGSILALGGPHGLAEAMAPSPPAAAGDIPRRALGKTGVDVSILCFGGAHWGRIEDDAEAIRVLHEAIDAGITFLDNAWEYNGGRSEELMGRALQMDRADMRLPRTEPVLPRASSAVSGFFFWGMIELVEA